VVVSGGQNVLVLGKKAVDDSKQRITAKKTSQRIRAKG
jgi:hypothetical protein